MNCSQRSNGSCSTQKSAEPFGTASPASAVDVAEVVGHAAHRTGLIAQGVDAHRTRHIQFAVRLESPGVGGAGGKAEVASRQDLPVATVAPVGDEVALGAM